MADAIVLSPDEVQALQAQWPINEAVPHQKPWSSKVWRAERVVSSFYSGGPLEFNSTLGLAFCHFDGSVRVVTLEGDVCGVLGDLQNPDKITNFAVDRRGRILVATYKSNLMRTFAIELAAEGRAFSVSFSETRVWKGADAAARVLRIDPTSTLIAVGGADGSLVVHDLRKGHMSHQLRSEDRDITLVRFHPTKLLLLYATAAGEMRVFDLYRNIIVANMNDHMSRVTDMVLLQVAGDDGLGALASVSSDHTINVWDLTSVQDGYPEGVQAGCKVVEGEPTKVKRTQLSPVKQIVTHETTYALGTATRAEIGFDSKGPWVIITAGDECLLKVWDPVSGELITSVPTPHLSREGPITRLERVGDELVTVADDRVVARWKLAGLEMISVLAGHLDDVFDVQAFRVNPLHELQDAEEPPAKKVRSEPETTETLGIFSLRGDERVHYFEISDSNLTTLELTRLRIAERRKEKRRQLLEKPILEGKLDRSKKVKQDERDDTDLLDFSEDEKYEAFTPKELVQINQKAEFRPMQQQFMNKHASMVVCAAVSADTCWLSTGDRSSTINIWSTRMKKPVAVLSGHSTAVTAVVWSRRLGKGENCSCLPLVPSFGENFFLCSGSDDGHVKRWNINRNKLRKVALALDNGRPVELLELASSSGSIVAHTKAINALDVSLNNSLLATGSNDRQVKIWTLPNLRPLVTCKGHKRGVWAVKFSPVEKVVVSAASDATIHLWSVTDGSCLKTLMGHKGAVHSVSFICPLATQLVSSGADRTIRVWNVKTSECVGVFEAHDDRVWAAQLVDNEDRQLPPTTMISCGSDGRVVVWKDKTVEEGDEEAAIKAQELKDAHEIENLVKDGRVEESLRMCLRLRKDRQAFSILEKKMTECFLRCTQEAASAEITGALAVGDIELTRTCPSLPDVGGQLDFDMHKWLLSLDDVLLTRLLNLIEIWQRRSAWMANGLLAQILQLFSGEALAKLEGFENFASRFVHLSQKHSDRLHTLKQKAFLLDIALSQVSILESNDPFEAC